MLLATLQQNRQHGHRQCNRAGCQAAHSGLNLQECWIEGESIYDNQVPPSLMYIHHKTQAAFGYNIHRLDNDLPSDIQ